jgi:hypothetical protein
MVIHFNKHQSIFIEQWVLQCDVIKAVYMIAHKIAKNKTADHFMMDNLLISLWFHLFNWMPIQEKSVLRKQIMRIDCTEVR